MINFISWPSTGEILILRCSVTASHVHCVHSTGGDKSHVFTSSDLFLIINLYVHTYVAPAAEAAVSSFEILFFSFLLLVPYTPIHEPSSSKRPEIRNSER